MDKEDKKVKIISKNCNKVEKVDIVRRMNEEIRLQREEIRQRDKGKNELNALENNLMFEQKDKRPKKRGFKKKVSAKLVHPRPERDICRYEKVREDIIKEREEAMLKFNFYEELHQTKTDIGLYSKETPKIRRKRELEKVKRE